MATVFEVTATVRFDDVAGGSFQRIYEFGNGSAQDNILFGQAGSGTGVILEVWNSGTAFTLSNPNVIVLGETATWTTSIDDSGLFEVYKDGVLVGSQQFTTAAVPADVERTSNLVGESNWTSDDDLIGEMSEFSVDTTLINAFDITITDTSNETGSYTGADNAETLDARLGSLETYTETFENGRNGWQLDDTSDRNLFHNGTAGTGGSGGLVFDDAQSGSEFLRAPQSFLDQFPSSGELATATLSFDLKVGSESGLNTTPNVLITGNGQTISRPYSVATGAVGRHTDHKHRPSGCGRRGRHRCRASDYSDQYHRPADRKRSPVPRHEIIFANCYPGDSLYPGQYALRTLQKPAACELFHLFPELFITGTHEAYGQPALQYSRRKHLPDHLRALTHVS